MKQITVLAIMLALFPLTAHGFGFDDDDGESNPSGKAATVTVGGEVSASLLGYADDFSEGADHVQLGDIFSGSLNFSAGMSFADAVINLNLQPAEQPISPISIDEAYVRVFFGSLEIEGGLRKLTWGKADSFSPLDVINPLDYSELTDLSDTMNLKIARPLIHASYRVGSFSKIEGVFVPSFEPLRYAKEGRWAPAETTLLEEQLAQLNTAGIKVDRPDDNDMSTLAYAQGGARFTTTIGPADIGLQYYYGRLTRPAVSVTYTVVPPYPVPIPTAAYFAYNPYHQIGVDWAQVLFGFNVRAEAAVNLTDDLDGDDGAVYNPAFAWSLGFDRDLFWGVNLNLQCNETIRLMYDKIGKNPLVVDTEANKDMTTTQIIAALSKKFLRDELELRFAALWGIEDRDFLLMPALIWTRDAVSVELSCGIFGGNEEGQFGQYYKNSFVKTVLTYSF
jgi:hypothetical protein